MPPLIPGSYQIDLSIPTEHFPASMSQQSDTSSSTIQGSQTISKEKAQVPAHNGRIGNERSFACPIFQYNNYHRQQHVCKGLHARKMADVRTHLTTGRNKHVEFLQCCPVCSEDVLNKEDFEDSHGYRGENCRKAPSRKRGGNAGEQQWLKLYSKLHPMEKHIPSACTYPLKRFQK